MKRKKFFLEVKVEGRAFRVPVEVKWERGWVISKNGKELASVCCKKVYYRDTLLNHLSKYCQELFNSGVKVDEYMSTFQHFERWKFPKYKNDEYESCGCGSANTLNIMLAIQDYFSQPENVKAISVAKTSTKFGL